MSNNNQRILIVKNDEIEDYDITFQDKVLNLDELDEYYINNAEIGKEFMVLPSIYYTKTMKLKKQFKLREYSGKGSFYIYPLKILFAFVYWLIYSKQKVKITINVRNKRDYFNLRKKSEKLNEEDKHYKTSYTEETKYINPTQLPYPDTMGGGAHRCDIWCIFQNMGLLNCSGNNELYHIMNVEELLEETSYDAELLEICENSQHCGDLIKKFKNGTYKAKFDGGNGHDDISVSLRNGKYYLYEGKHRVCISKRFHIPIIPAVVETEVVEEAIEYNDNYNVIHPFKFRQEYNCEQIIGECFDKFGAIGLGENYVLKLLETVEEKGDLISLIQQLASRSIYEIYKLTTK